MNAFWFINQAGGGWKAKHAKDAFLFAMANICDNLLFPNRRVHTAVTTIKIKVCVGVSQRKYSEIFRG